MALINPCFKDQIGLICGGRRKREKRRKKRGRRWRRSSKPRYGTWIFGMKTNLDYEFHEIWHVSLGL